MQFAQTLRRLLCPARTRIYSRFPIDFTGKSHSRMRLFSVNTTWKVVAKQYNVKTPYSAFIYFFKQMAQDQDLF